MGQDSAKATKPLPKVTESDISRFWSKVALTCNPNKCWEWTCTKNIYGYGKFGVVPAKYVRATLMAHRLSYFINNQVDPVGYVVLHTCDNPGCVNPNHLKLGTTLDNVTDKIRKGRMRTLKGTDLPQAKLTEDMVREIRKRYEQGDILQADLAKEYGVGKRAISKIITGIRWKHIL